VFRSIVRYVAVESHATTYGRTDLATQTTTSQSIQLRLYILPEVQTIRNFAHSFGSRVSARSSNSHRNLVLVLTACLGDSEKDAAAFAEHVDIARARDVPFIWFSVDCTTAVLGHRIGTPERQASARSKLTNSGAWRPPALIYHHLTQRPELLDQVIIEHSLLRPARVYQDMRASIENVKMRDEHVDTTRGTVEEAAEQVFQKIMQGGPA
jgi:hypothetical protein